MRMDPITKETFAFLGRFILASGLIVGVFSLLMAFGDTRQHRYERLCHGYMRERDRHIDEAANSCARGAETCGLDQQLAAGLVDQVKRMNCTTILRENE